MLFNSIAFALFLPSVFIFYWFVTERNLKFQNLLLLVASYFFYAFWDYRFLLLLAFSTLLGFFTGIKIYDAKNSNAKRTWLWLGISINLGFLGVFKYYNFFASSLNQVLLPFGIQANLFSHFILPVGISFYTFHGISYILDVYSRRITPVKNLVEYAVFVGFFPLLVAGPIERATHLLPQIQKKRQFDYSKAVDGLKQILWGLFKKIVIADSCAEYANLVFNNSANYSGSTLALGVIFFAFQIYSDFSGYSDIALGTARLLGFELLRNFDFPYFSRSISEFWSRWHISLSRWFRDYVFFPLERRRAKYIGQPLNVIIVFFLTGLWHGANWTFIVWGLLHGILLIINSYWGRKWVNLTKTTSLLRFQNFIHVLETVLTFILVSILWIFFRANNIGHAINYISGLFSSSIIHPVELPSPYLVTSVLIGLFLLIEWQGRKSQYAIEHLGTKWPKFLRLGMYYAMIFAIFYFAGPKQQFVYFQF